MDYNTLLQAHGIDINDCFEFESFSDGIETIIFIKLKPNQRKCIYCNSNNSLIKEYKIKSIKSLSTGKTFTTITFTLPRYYCKKCNKTYTHQLNKYAINSVSKITRSRMLSLFSEIRTFKSIALEVDLSITETINIFDEICPDLRIPLTQAICIDEFSNVRKSEYKFACALVDFETHKFIDILPSRTTPYLDEYFNKILFSKRQAIKYIITDMYDGYIFAAKRWFPNATIAIDPFHYMTYITDAVQSIRRRVLDDDSKYFSDRSWMGTHWRLLTTNPKNFPDKNMTLKSGVTISYYDRVKRFCQQDKELMYAFFKLQSIYLDIERLSFEKAQSYFEMTIKSLLNSTSPEFVECGKTWNHYKQYIINSFITFKGKRLSNGPMEGINKRVKDLKHIMSGYRNSSRFYKRLILIQNNKKGR